MTGEEVVLVAAYVLVALIAVGFGVGIVAMARSKVRERSSH